MHPLASVAYKRLITHLDATLTQGNSAKSFGISTYKNQRGAGLQPTPAALATPHPPRPGRGNSPLISSPRRHRRFAAPRDTGYGTPTRFQSSLSYFVSSLSLIGNSIGANAGASAIFSISGYCSRSGSGTFTFVPFRILINCSALTTPLPWK